MSAPVAPIVAVETAVEVRRIHIPRRDGWKTPMQLRILAHLRSGDPRPVQFVFSQYTTLGTVRSYSVLVEGSIVTWGYCDMEDSV